MAATPPVRLRPLTPAGKPLVANLVQLYLYDMSAVLAFPVGRDGRFEYDFLERFWQSPYLIEADGEIAGFALVIEGCPVTGRTDCRFMAEFFVMRPWRGRGVGRRALDMLLGRHSGSWHIAAIARNAPATAFWRSSLAGRGAEARRVGFEGEDWLVLAFSA